MKSVRKWWQRRKKERKRLKLLALVRKVREEQGDYERPLVGDYDNVSPVKRRSVKHARRRRRVSHTRRKLR